MRELRGKVAVVTGAGSGIGRGLVLVLSRAGAVVAACDIDGDSAAETAKLAGDRSTAHRVDVSSEAEMRQLVAAVLDDHGAVDVVVNNAGIAMLPTPGDTIPLDAYHRVMAVNYWGIVHGSLFFLPHLAVRPEANLVNVSSWAGLLAVSGGAAYASSKFAVRGFTETLRMELRATPVRVTLACPGITRTPILAHSPFVDDGDATEIQKRLERRVVPGPDAVARRIVDAIRRDRPRVLVGADTKLMDGIARLLPGAYSGLLHRGVARANALLQTGHRP